MFEYSSWRKWGLHDFKWLLHTLVESRLWKCSNCSRNIEMEYEIMKKIILRLIFSWFTDPMIQLAKILWTLRKMSATLAVSPIMTGSGKVSTKSKIYYSKSFIIESLIPINGGWTTTITHIYIICDVNDLDLTPGKGEAIIWFNFTLTGQHHLTQLFKREHHKSHRLTKQVQQVRHHWTSWSG